MNTEWGDEQSYVTGMLTQEQFLARYHHYQTQNPREALEEAVKANEQGIVGNEAVAVSFGTVGYGLMLRKAFNAIAPLGDDLVEVTDDWIRQKLAEWLDSKRGERESGDGDASPAS